MDMINEKLERWYSMNEVCQYLGITRDTCLTWIEKRGMPAVKIGRTWKFKISEIDGDVWWYDDEEIIRDITTMTLLQYGKKYTGYWGR